MTKKDKVLQKILSGTSDANFAFKDIRQLLKSLGFEERIRGSHFIFYRKDIEEIINIQTLPDKKAKVYQVKQIRSIIIKYKLGNK